MHQSYLRAIIHSSLRVLHSLGVTSSSAIIKVPGFPGFQYNRICRYGDEWLCGGTVKSSSFTSREFIDDQYDLSSIYRSSSHPYDTVTDDFIYKRRNFAGCNMGKKRSEVILPI